MRANILESSFEYSSASHFPSNFNKTDSLQEKFWHLLLRNIHSGECTPFLGSEMCTHVLPPKAEVARTWAQKFDYPFTSIYEIARVAQFLAVEYSPLFPKDEIIKTYDGVKPRVLIMCFPLFQGKLGC